MYIILEFSTVAVLPIAFALLTLLVVDERDLFDELTATIVIFVVVAAPIAVLRLKGRLSIVLFAIIVESIASLILKLLVHCLVQSGASLRDLEYKIG